MHIKKYNPDSVKQLIKLNKIQASDLSNIEFDSDYQELNNELINKFNNNSLHKFDNNNNIYNMPRMTKSLKSPKLLILNLSKNRTQSLTPSSSKFCK